ncbi:accessory factor UbiK family protein [Formicincola oecophyllae]|uniref:Accessory factor UbiK family protein n=1 Tax=Formicincola oecophyllae TaxID=2558361 RepID=A0A4Y6UAR7_9PROT|nr:accessory factor UbiK family protein [Formicincola oecophyllae]QDH13481.1 accessory factor UbiK family protein [Formicincola oecophyllae]
MAERPRLFDDITGLAGTALSAFQGAKEELESLGKGRLEEIVNRLDLVRRDEFDALAEMAARCRRSEEELTARVAQLEKQVQSLSDQVSALSATETAGL